MAETKMFSWITHTVNPLCGGECFNCAYCWARALKKRHNWAKYRGPWRIAEKELKTFPDGSFVFPFDMTDIGHPTIPKEIILRVLEWMKKQPKVKFLLLTKEPRFHVTYAYDFPPNVYVAATIETNRYISPVISGAPDPSVRFTAMGYMKANFPELKRALSVEPVMDFDLTLFANLIVNVAPEIVALGYDNYHTGLPEPPLSKVESLITVLEREGIKVYRKTLREAEPTNERFSGVSR